jgi:hypothetical protein
MPSFSGGWGIPVNEGIRVEDQCDNKDPLAVKNYVPNIEVGDPNPFQDVSLKKQ